MCSFLGYLFYFIMMANFSWVTVFGFDLYWSVYKLVQRDHDTKQNFPLSIQLAALPVLFPLALFASKFILSNNFLLVHHVALASLVTTIVGLLLLSIDLLRNCQDEDRGPLANINVVLGLGLPLLLTAVFAALHLLAPREHLLNPQVNIMFLLDKHVISRFGEHCQCIVIVSLFLFLLMIMFLLNVISQVGEQDQCIVIPLNYPLRFTLLYHLPILR